MTQKGVYPYEYIDSFEKFQEAELPTKDVFCNSLTEQEISETDYTHASRDVKDLGDYHNFYLLTNALLLEDVFENFRDVCLQQYGLDPEHNYTSPGLSRQAALKMIDVELDLFSDINQHLLIEEIREGWQWSATNTPDPKPLAWKITTSANAIGI